MENRPEKLVGVGKSTLGALVVKEMKANSLHWVVQLK